MMHPGTADVNLASVAGVIMPLCKIDLENPVLG